MTQFQKVLQLTTLYQQLAPSFSPVMTTTNRSKGKHRKRKGLWPFNFYQYNPLRPILVLCRHTWHLLFYYYFFCKVKKQRYIKSFSLNFQLDITMVKAKFFPARDTGPQSKKLWLYTQYAYASTSFAFLLPPYLCCCISFACVFVQGSNFFFFSSGKL